MESPLKHNAATAFICLMLTVVVSCSAAGIKGGPYYPIRVENPDGLKLFLVKSYIREGNLVVYGNVRRSRLRGNVGVASTIRVSIKGIDGGTIAEKSVTYTPSALSRHKAHNDARFYARFDIVPERGALIRVGGETAAGED